MKKRNNFASILLLLTGFSFILIFVLSLFGNLSESNQKILQYSLFPLFCISFLLVGWIEMGKPRLKKSLFSIKNFLLFSLSFLTVFSINQKTGIWATALFAIASLLYLLKYKKWYSLNKVYYVVFAYALLRIFGTIGTIKGFHFPDKILSFFVLPLAFSCFRLKRETTLRILKIFFRAIAVFMVLSLIFWWYNKSYFGISTFEWLTSKLNLDSHNGYHWVTGWAYYEHPTYISLVIIAALISGFYLYHRKQSTAFITKFELGVFCVLSIIMTMALESRIGVICTLFVIVCTIFYQLYLKTKYFRIAFLVCIVIGAISSYLLEDHLSYFTQDSRRKIEYTLAINYIKDHPLWGSGYGQQKYVLTEQAELMKDEIPVADYYRTYTHNQFLGDMVQFGIWGLILLLILLYVLFRYAARSRSYPLQLFLSVVLIFMLIEEPLTGQAGITRVLVFVSFFIHISETEVPVKSYSILKKKNTNKEKN